MPCNLGQRELAAHVAAGVRAAGGTPLEFNTIAISDNLTQGTVGMRASLVSREVIADSVELVGRSPALRRPDLPGRLRQDRPGLAMAMVRLDVPGLILYSGAMAPGTHRGAQVTIQDVWEGVGAHEGGLITDDELLALERDACPGYGACTGHFTANTMAVAIDFLGLGPIGLGSVPAADPAKAEAGEAAGRLVLDVIERDVRPSSLVTRAGLENAIVGVTGTGGSTNASAAPAGDRERSRRRARARRLRSPLGLDPGCDEPDPGRAFRRGRHAPRRRHRGGDQAAAPASARRRSTVDGRTIAEHAAGARDPDGEVIATAGEPFKPGGALRVLRGNLAPDGAVVKLAGHERTTHRGPARVFGSGGCVSGGRLRRASFSRARSSSSATRAGRRAGHAGDALDHLGDRRARAGRLRRARHRWPLQRRDPGVMVGHVAPEAVRGGPIAFVRDGDVISIDVDARTLEVEAGRGRARAAQSGVGAAGASGAPTASSPSTRAAFPRPRTRSGDGMTGRLDGKVALVTGAGSGIGRALAVGLAAEGAVVHLNDLEDPTEVLAELPESSRGLALAFDVASPAQIADNLRGLERLDVLVNCAGIPGWMNLDDPSGDIWEEIRDRVIDTNLKGTFFCSVEAARLMRVGGGGSIVNVSSVVAARGLRNLAAYAASKGGINALTIQLAVELAPDQIRVNAFAPGATNVQRNLDDDPSYRETWSPLDPARPDRRAGGHGRPDGVPRVRGVLTCHRPAVLRRRRLDRGGQGSRRDTSTSRNASSNATIDSATPLRRNRDFVLLLTGRLLSTLGSQVTAIAYPLLVLAVTHSPAKAGFVGFAGLLPYAVFGLARRRRGRPLEPQAADDRGRRGAARSRSRRSPRRSSSTGCRSGRSRSSRSSRVRASVFFNTAHAGALRAIVPRQQLPAAVGVIRGASGGGDARRAAARRRALRARPRRAVPLRRRLLRVLVPLARADADAVPGGA